MKKSKENEIKNLVTASSDEELDFAITEIMKKKRAKSVGISGGVSKQRKS